MPQHPSLTAIQALAGDSMIDLADSHSQLRPVVDDLPSDVLSRLARASRRGLEAQFLDAYSDVSGEPVAPQDVVLFPSASQAIDTVAKYLAEQRVKRISVPSPTFDSLPRLMRRAGLELEPFRQEDDDAVLDAVYRSEAVFLVLPNNPTGTIIGPRAAALLPKAAKRSGCRVVFDRTWRFYQERQFTSWLDADFDWIDIEDTGKTWSTLETKISFVRTRRPEVLTGIEEIFHESWIRTPPLNLHVAAQAIVREGGASRARSAMTENRDRLLDALGPMGFELISEPAGFALLRLPISCPISSGKLTDVLLDAGVAILPGGPFYWDDPPQGDRLVRISLLRPVDEFADHVLALTRAIEAYV